MGAHWKTWSGVLGAALLLVGAVGSRAAGPKTAIFNVTAVHNATEGQVTINSKVWITPTQARADITHPLQGKQLIVVSGGYWYQLDPASKKGLKAPLPPEMKKSTDNFSLLVGKFAFEADSALKMSKKVRTETVSGYPCDVFQGAHAEGGESRTITVWVPQKMDPSFPLKAVLEDKSSLQKPGATINQSYSVTITLSNLQLRSAIPASVFALPSGYQIKSVPAAGAAPKPGAPKRGK